VLKRPEDAGNCENTGNQCIEVFLSMPETAVLPLEEVLDLGIEIADPLAAMCAEWNRFYGWSALKNAVLSLN
jgi:hypothetical protein